MSYMILGKAVKNEYLALGTLLTAVGGALALSGGKKDAGAKQPSAAAAAASKIDASSLEEEAFIANFMKEAEKEAKH